MAVTCENIMITFKRTFTLTKTQDNNHKNSWVSCLCTVLHKHVYGVHRCVCQGLWEQIIYVHTYFLQGVDSDKKLHNKPVNINMSSDNKPKEGCIWGIRDISSKRERGGGYSRVVHSVAVCMFAPWPTRDNGVLIVVLFRHLNTHLMFGRHYPGLVVPCDLRWWFRESGQALNTMVHVARTFSMTEYFYHVLIQNNYPD